ncbi:MAG: dipicolinate synthase [Oscillospiraceae bacterium]|jgi:dipicolinate synthase subunit A|nr:dipicolinate synthase [Oscillospiraceae bacterium]
MDKKPKIAIIGGDARQLFAAQTIATQGYPVVCSHLAVREGEKSAQSNLPLDTAMRQAKILLCPVPFSRDGVTIQSDGDRKITIETFCGLLQKKHTLIAGDIPEVVQKRCEALNIQTHALLERGDFALLNAIPTAEGAVLEAIRLSPQSIHLSHCVVLGYGRCGRVLAQKLRGLGAIVTIVARQWKTAAIAISDGFQAITFEALPLALPSAGFVFNTVPAQVFGEEHLRKLPPFAVVVDIASGAGGVDFDAAMRAGISAALCPGLPGKTAPMAAGAAIAQVTLHLLEGGGADDSA